MKKQKIKKFLKKNLYIVISLFFIVGVAFGSYISYLITSQEAVDLGSNNSVISFTGTTNRLGYYVNNDDNSAVINNYFIGYYFDSLYGFFKLDWSTNNDENVRIIDSTGECTTGYGYKLGGKAYSANGGFIEFNYDNDTFVYYCLDDGKLHGKAYSSYIGYQSFDGISISVVNDVIDLTQNVNNDTVFENDSTTINNSVSESSSGNLTEEQNNLGGDIIQIDVTKESMFYIIK